MSRFLDAMRDKGKSAAAGESARAYKGQIVDAGDVLGPRVKDHAAFEGSDELSIQPLSAGSEAAMPPIPDVPAVSGSAIDQRERVVPPVEPEVVTAPANTAAKETAASDASSSASTGINTAGRQPTNLNKSAFSVRNLDPLFYLIVGVAAVGLFACLYALITQNDAYFEREYQQLQKESAALQARLAASSRLEAALTAAVSEQNTTPAQTSAAVPAPAPAPEPEPEPAAGQQTVTVDAVDAVARVASDEIQPPVASVVETPQPNVEIVESAVVTDVDAVTAAPEQAIVAEPSASESALVLLQQQVEDLRVAMTSQDEKILRLEQDNLELTSILGNTKTEVSSVTQKTTQSASPGKAQTVPSSDKVQPQVLPVVSEAPMIASQSTLSASLIESPVLYTPQRSHETEITDLVQQGYLAYRAGDFTAASGFYGKALEFDPYDRDTNLGVAATAQAVGDFKLAEDRYRHLLTLDPADEVAFSALLNLTGYGGQDAIIEVELTQHAGFVNNPHKLYAILGNYYSQQMRWINAESAYQIALRGGLSNPDLLFNYAVTLDNMGRIGQAAEYYSQALGGIASDSYSFDAEAARQRLQSLLAVGQ